jgi:hypothetical protein
MQVRATQVCVNQDNFFPLHGQRQSQIGGKKTFAGSSFAAAYSPDSFFRLGMNGKDRYFRHIFLSLFEPFHPEP